MRKLSPIEALPPQYRQEAEERAAIREYDGLQTREAAERGAVEDVQARLRARGRRR